MSTRTRNLVVLGFFGLVLLALLLMALAKPRV